MSSPHHPHVSPHHPHVSTKQGATVTDTLIPEHLKAGAALWSLRAALTLLTDREAAEDRAIADERVAAADPLKSPIYGTRQAAGGHGDPTTDALLVLDDPPRDNPYTALAVEVAGQLANVAQHLPEPVRDGMRVVGADSVTRIEAALPAMSRAAATATWQLADRLDSRIRRLLREPADRRYVPRVRCPWCDAVSLMMRMAPPVAARVVECATCDGAWLWTEMTGRSVSA
jgi:hypothetical protein